MIVACSTLLSSGQLWLQIKMARPQVKAEQQPGAFAGRGMGRGFSSRGGRGGRAGYDQYAYPQGQYNTGYGGGGYGYDASGGYGYGDYGGGYQQYGAGMQMVPMMLPSGQVCVFCHLDRNLAWHTKAMLQR